MSDSVLHHLCEVAASFHQRGYAFGSTGNLSIRLNDELWVTPTGQSLRKLAPEQLACIGLDGQPRNDNKASKEYPFHLAAYQAASARANALVHLHSTYTVALSCLEELDPAEPLPAITPYYLMRVAPLAVLPYFRPGSTELAGAVGEAAEAHDCLLLRNHGLICLGRTMDEAVDRAEELEETARLFFLLRQERVRVLSGAEKGDINRVFRAQTGSK